MMLFYLESGLEDQKNVFFHYNEKIEQANTYSDRMGKSSNILHGLGYTW